MSDIQDLLADGPALAYALALAHAEGLGDEFEAMLAGDDQPRPVQESKQPLPPEFLAALVAAYDAGDMDAVGDLMDLADDPAALAAVLNGTVTEAVATLWERMASRPGWTWNDQSKRWTKDQKAARPERKSAPGQSPKEQLVARKAAAEPARQAARAAWAAAVKDGVTASQLPELAGHLGSLTRDELRTVAAGLAQRVGGLKQQLVDRLLAKVGVKTDSPQSTTNVVDTNNERGIVPGQGAQPAAPDPEAKAMTADDIIKAVGGDYGVQRNDWHNGTVELQITFPVSKRTAGVVKIRPDGSIEASDSARENFPSLFGQAAAPKKAAVGENYTLELTVGKRNLGRVYLAKLTGPHAAYGFDRQFVGDGDSDGGRRQRKFGDLEPGVYEAQGFAGNTGGRSYYRVNADGTVEEIDLDSAKKAVGHQQPLRPARAVGDPDDPMERLARIADRDATSIDPGERGYQ